VAGKKERQRRLARQRFERRAARQAVRQQAVRRTTRIVAVSIVLVAVAAVVTVTVLSLHSTPKAAAVKPAVTPTSAATPTPTPTVSEPAHHCVYLPTAGQPAARDVGLPPTTPNWTATYRATVTTNRGTIVIDLLNSKATCTVNSFVHLASKAYFNRTHCHRLTTSGIYVLQCGDPTATGTGGPGYGFADENLAGATYPAGTVAMAHSSLPNSNGSQFFLVYQNTSLPPSYTPFGTIVSGMSVLQTIAKAGSDNSGGPGDGHPKLPVIIEKITITKT
jgi:peptidyl-prolyl cis-trans isomerase B (cyclophilin B)